MALRFFRRIRLAPWLSLNLSKGGASLSVGPRGAKYTIGSSGTRRTVGLPGTGLYYTERGNKRRGRAKTRGQSAQATRHPLDLGFFKRLITPANEEAFVDGMKAVTQGNHDLALTELSQATHLPDGAFMAGMLSLKQEQYDDAISYFKQANTQGLGTLFAKYEISVSVELPITTYITAVIEPGTRGIALALAEAHQARGDWQNALDHLKALHKLEPDDLVILLSIVEIQIAEIGGKDACQRVVELTQDIDNTSDITAALLYWKGKALFELGLNTATRDALTAAFRRKKDRDENFLLAVQYQRALVYAAMGKASRARAEYERIYSDNPGFRDVAQRLGLG